MIQRQWPG